MFPDGPVVPKGTLADMSPMRLSGKDTKTLRRTHLDENPLQLHYKIVEAREWCDKGNITEAYESLVQAICEISGEKQPRRTVHKPWFDIECRTLKRLVVSLWYHGTDEQYWMRRRQCRKLLKRKREMYQEELLQNE